MIVTNAGTIPVLHRVVHTELVYFIRDNNEVGIRTHNISNRFHFGQCEYLEIYEKRGVRGLKDCEKSGVKVEYDRQVWVAMSADEL